MRDSDQRARPPAVTRTIRGFFGGVLMVLGAIWLLIFGLTEWVKYDWETSPTIYPDGRVIEPGREKSGNR